ncbi:hypothetical protein M378DRAFT_15817 [Amanita muscaria Koide BX008]|uniref:Uncharacterized protein n=1 Tax=Amanita muscaria (strain Koide BX008) TaxID=946122 RepID=A0A0C2WA37_AMAMK|nr:hypothetical protein M378DRAFT_15817 [Amanita muscaria Koide BX008]
MALFEKLYFPSPPPTSNTLTPKERACLRRSTTKLGRVLGVTPRVLDVDDRDFDATYSQRTLATSHTGSSVSLSHQSPTRTPMGKRSKGQHRDAPSTLNPRDFHTDECHRSKGALLVENGESKLGMKSTPIHRLPLIRVARPLRSQHVSMTLNHASPDSYSSSESADSDDDGASTLDAPDNVNSVRRKKMERLCRILGEEISVSIVFPEHRSDDSGYDSDNGHWQNSAVSKRPSLTARTPCHSSPSPTPVKLQTDQTPLSAGMASSPPRPVEPRLISARDFGAISSTIPHKESLKGFPAGRPHYRPRSSLRLTCDDGMQHGSQTKQNDNPVLGGRSLRTISESSMEVDGLSRMPIVGEARWEKTGTRARELSLSSPASHSSLRSEWYPSGEETDDAHTDDTLVERKEAPTGLDTTQGAPKRVWSHKRKPPPTYEP